MSVSLDVQCEVEGHEGETENVSVRAPTEKEALAKLRDLGWLTKPFTVCPACLERPRQLRLDYRPPSVWLAIVVQDAVARAKGMAPEPLAAKAKTLLLNAATRGIS
jgi:hypothetical protein